MVIPMNRATGNTVRSENESGTALSPFWPSLEFLDSEFFGPPADSPAGAKKGLLLSGPSRNGNHLLHSLLDSHPQLPRIAGEDSILNAVFDRLLSVFEETCLELESTGAAAYLRSLSGSGKFDKWQRIHGYFAGEEVDEQDGSAQLWSGVQYGRGKAGFVFDYQDTEVAIDYPAFRSALSARIPSGSAVGSLYAMIVHYMECLPVLDREFAARQNKLMRYSGILFGSGSRGELDWMLARGDYLDCVAPVRPFETYYYSFSKGFFNTTDVRPDILQEAWEHWSHKVTDYLIIQSNYPDRLCMVNFEHMVLDTESTMRRVCDFLQIAFDPIVLEPTVLGVATKGNSSDPKSESARGTVYNAPLARKLDKSYWPDGYQKLWDAVLAVAI